MPQSELFAHSPDALGPRILGGGQRLGALIRYVRLWRLRKSEMSEVQHPGALARFGLFEVHLGAGELRKQGQLIKLQEKPFQALALLLERAGSVVTREEFRNRLWASDTFVAFDDNLNAAIKR